MLAERRITLDEVVRELAGLPEGVAAPLHVRSVLVPYRDGWANHCTQLRVGPFADEYRDVKDQRIGAARLLAEEIGQLNQGSIQGLAESMVTWSHVLSKELKLHPAGSALGPETLDNLANFQAGTNAYRHASRNPFSHLPAWVVEVHDTSSWQSNVEIPRSHYYDSVTGIFRESLGALCELWLHDSTLKEANNFLNSYKIVVPDGRGVLTASRLRDQQLLLTIAGSSRAPLTLTAVVRMDDGQIERRKWPVNPGDQVALEAPGTARQVEAMLLDESSEWLDQAFLPESLLRSSRGEAWVEQLSAPRYAAVLRSYQKAVAFATGPERDLQNAAKEAMSALESAAKIVSGRSSDSLGQALKHLSQSRRLDPSLSRALEALWGYVSRKPFVRHGGVRPEELGESEASFVLEVSRSAISLLLSIDQ